MQGAISPVHHSTSAVRCGFSQGCLRVRVRTAADLMNAQTESSMGPPIGGEAPSDTGWRRYHGHEVVWDEDEGCKYHMVPRVACR